MLSTPGLTLLNSMIVISTVESTISRVSNAKAGKGKLVLLVIGLQWGTAF